MAGDDDVLLATRRGPALVLTFNRPEKLNAISSAMLAQLDRRLREAEADPGVRAVILTGAGPKAFVAGADIAEYAAGDHAAFVAYQAESRRLFSWLDAFPKPVIGAVNGYALGGGFELCLCCALWCFDQRPLGARGPDRAVPAARHPGGPGPPAVSWPPTAPGRRRLSDEDAPGGVVADSSTRPL